MIYLIDDNQSNQQKARFNANYLFDNTFDSILEKIYAVRFNQTNELKEKLKNADAIFLHNTFEDQNDEGQYIKSSLRFRKMIEDDIVNVYDIPFILFSNGMNDTVFDYENNSLRIDAINKDLFYENLYPFLEQYQKTKKLEFRIISSGLNYKAKIAVNLSDSFLNSSNKTFSLNDLDLEKFEKYYSMTDSKMIFSHFLDYIEDNIFSVNEFRILIKTINKSLLRYGRNIHH